jgi:uncharacterized protein (DUF302 family)
MLFEVDSRRTAAGIDAAIREAAGRHKFGVIGVIDLKEKMNEKGVEFDRDCKVYEVCNPHQAKRALDANGAVSATLPCRISVYGTPGNYRIATILPTAMMQALGAPEIDSVAREVEASMISILKESA